MKCQVTNPKYPKYSYKNALGASSDRHASLESQAVRARGSTGPEPHFTGDTTSSHAGDHIVSYGSTSAKCQPSDFNSDIIQI